MYLNQQIFIAMASEEEVAPRTYTDEQQFLLDHQVLRSLERLREFLPTGDEDDCACVKCYRMLLGAVYQHIHNFDHYKRDVLETIKIQPTCKRQKKLKQ